MPAEFGVDISKILLVHRSSVLRATLQLMLATYAEQILTAPDVQRGEESIARNCDLDLVVTDVTLPDGDGFALLRCIGMLQEPKPRVILVADHGDETDARRAMEMGAAAYLEKPVCFGDLAGALRRRAPDWNADRPIRRRSRSRAYLIEPGAGANTAESFSLFWFIRDISPTGAFLEIPSPLPLGTVLRLAFEIDGAMVNVRARVERVQEPSWVHAGGVGVSFADLDERDVERIAKHVEAAGQDVW